MTEKMDALLPLVAELADKYTSKESTSISFHTARQLMGAVIYCIQEYQQGGIGTGFNLPVEERISVREAYQSGFKMVQDKVKRTNMESRCIRILLKRGYRYFLSTMMSALIRRTIS